MTSYLLVNKWRGASSVETSIIGMTRRVNAFGGKARKLAEAYELQLNGTEMRTDEAKIKAIKSNAYWFTVCAIPDSQAREHHSFFTFEECPYFQEALK